MYSARRRLCHFIFAIVSAPAPFVDFSSAELLSGGYFSLFQCSTAPIVFFSTRELNISYLREAPFQWEIADSAHDEQRGSNEHDSDSAFWV